MFQKKKKGFILAPVLALALLISTGCSTYRFLYNSIDIFIINFINSYFDLSTEQRQFLREEINRVKVWHRSVEMPRYIEALIMIKKRMPGSITRDDVALMKQRLRVYGETFYRHIEERTLDFLSSLDDSQINHFNNKMSESMDKYEKSLREEKEKTRNEEVKSRMKMLNFIYGEIADKQEKAIAAMEGELQDVTGARIRQFRANTEEFQNILAKRKDRNELRNSIRKFIADDSTENREPFERTLDAHYRQMTDIFMKIHNTVMTGDQKKHAAERIDWIIGIIRDLQK